MLYDVNVAKWDASTPLVAAIDIGGTEICAGIVEPASGTVVERRGVLTPGDDRPAAEAIVDLIDELRVCAAWPLVQAFGIASAGPVDLALETISPFNIPHWRGLPVGRIVRDRVGELAVRLVGDGTAMAYGEQCYGAAQGADHVLGIVVSTGVGGGLVVDGRCIEGARGNAGFVGHIVVDPSGDPCPCGRRGCVETIASGPSLTRRALRHGWQPGDGPANARAVAASAVAGDEIAADAVASAVGALARGVADAVVLLDLDMVVLGGGVGLGIPWMADRLAVLLNEDLSRPIDVRRAVLAHHAGLIGAGRLASSLHESEAVSAVAR